MFPERIETDRLELLALTPANVDALDYYEICSGNVDGGFETVHRRGNERSRRATEKLVARWGGRHEGRLRNYWTDPGGPADAHRYTISRGEYEEARE